MVVAEGVADRGEDQAGHVVHHRAGSRTTDSVDLTLIIHEDSSCLLSVG